MRAWVIAALLVAPAMAEGAGLAVRFDPEVMRVSVPWPGDVDQVRAAAQAGTVSLRWRFRIERVRPWWRPNEELGEVELVRTIAPDLLAGGWNVEESPSGLVWHFRRLDAALGEALNLSGIPLVERTLLQAGARYRLEVEIA
ncbi:MAG: DUF4390 domain-containing protein, partial [Zetaproteobacteria bacterium]